MSESGRFSKLFQPLFFLFLFFTIDVFPHHKTGRRGKLLQIKHLILIPFIIFIGINLLIFWQYSYNIQITRKNPRLTWITFSQSLIVIESLLILYKKSSIRETVLILESYLQPIVKLVLKRRRNTLQKVIFVLCGVVVLKHIVLSQLLFHSLLPAVRRRNFSALGHFVVYIMSIIGELGFTLLDSYLLYYCFLCWVLKRAFQVYVYLLNNNSLSDHLTLDYYSRISKALSHVDAVTSIHLFWIFTSLLFNFFCQLYIVVHHKTNLYEVGITTWSALMFLSAVVSAASVGESSELLKKYLSEHDPKYSEEVYTRLMSKIKSNDNHLSVWKLFTLKRVTIINVAGAFITYAVIML